MQTISITHPTVQHLRERNRAERARAAVVQNVVERLEVYGALAAHHDAIHPTVTREHAARIVAAVLGLSGGLQ